MSEQSTAQPDAMPFLKFSLDDVVVRELGGLVLGATNVIPAGNSFELRTDLSLDGAFVPLLIGDEFNIFHHVRNIEGGPAILLPLSPVAPSFKVGFTTPGATALNPAHMTITSGPYTTGDANIGTPGDLQISAGSASGTFLITTHIHAVVAGIRPIVTALNDGLLIQVV